MATTNFTNGSTPIVADWLNDADEAIYGNKVHVKHYGATGDGVTDDSAAFIAWNAYCNANASANRVIDIGVYNLASLVSPLNVVGNCTISGGGMDQSKILWTENASTPVNLFSFDSAITSIGFKDFTIRGTHDTNHTELAAYPLLVEGASADVRIERVRVHYSRIMGIVVRSATKCVITDCVVDHCARDGISAANCDSVSITDNSIHDIDDDAIALHNQAYSWQRGHVITGNKIRKAQGIVALGINAVTITGNTIEYFFGRAIRVDSIAVDTVVFEGVNASLAITITDNIILDAIDRAALDALSSTSPYIVISGASAQKGSLTYIPGEHGTSPYPYYDNISDITENLTTTPIPVSGFINIQGNIIGKTMPETGLFSALGVGKFWLRGGEYDADLSATATWQEDAIVLLGGSISGLNISNNISFGIANFLSMQVATTLRNTKVCGNIVSDALYVFSAPSDTNKYDILFEDNIFDLDPYLRDANRVADGTYTANGSPQAFLLQGNKGLKLRRNTFKNMCRITDADINALIEAGDIEFDDNILECYPVVHGVFDATNIGIGFPPELGCRVNAMNSTPTDAAYGEYVTLAATSSRTIPTAGYYVFGHFVKNSSPVVAGAGGSQYTVDGWTRLTTGSAHVLNTDWVEVRTLTGT